jgi:hypothetical protein
VDDDINQSQTPLGDCMGAPELGSVLGVGTLFSPDDQQQTSPTSVAVEPPAGDVEDLWLQDAIHLDDLKTAVEFIRMLRDARLDDLSLGMSRE